MRYGVLIAGFILVTGCASHTPAEPSTAGQASLQRGHDLVAAHCSSCHAIERSGESPAPEAPAFRTLSHNYRVDTLQEALAEGISVGHPAMPEFQFGPGEVDDLVSYLQSIQEEPAPHP